MIRYFLFVCYIFDCKLNVFMSVFFPNLNSKLINQCLDLIADWIKTADFVPKS